MASSNNKRVDSSAPDRLIETAQRLIGVHGVDGISLRQIGKAAGSGNNYAVQYHFGSATGLIRAILERNLPQLETMRTHMLAEADKQALLSDIRTLVDILFRPLVDHVDDQGERSCARFVLALHSSPIGVRYVGELNHLMQASHHALDLLYNAVPQLPPSLIRERLRLITFMFLASIFNRNPPFDGDRMDEALIDNVLAMATTALVAPVSDGIGEMLRNAEKNSAGTKLGSQAETARTP